MGPDAFYRNNGNGTFTDVTKEAGFEKNKGACSHAGFLDYDNDGHLDLYVYNPTWNGTFDNRFAFYRNTGDGKFIDVTEETGIKLGDAFSWGGGFADYDSNGYLDLYVGNWRSNLFFKNNGDGTFTDATAESGLEETHNGVNIASGDYDNDGDMDIYLSNGEGQNNHEPAVLFQNDGDGAFTDVTKKAGINAIRRGRCTAFFDYDNDEDLDIITVAGTSPLLLYSNNGDGTFTEVAAKSKLRTASCERLAVGDYDNDGYIDVYLMPWSKQRFLFRNNGDGTFADVTNEAGVRGLFARAGGCAFADYDNDGDLDLFEGNNDTRSALYRNEGNDNHWLHIKPIGTKSNRDGVGARITVKTGDLSMIREINPGCSRGYNPLLAYFGLGQNAKADSVEIRWPSGQVDVYENIDANQRITVKEGVAWRRGFVSEWAMNPKGKVPTVLGEIKRFALLQNYPNPFNPETWIPYQLAVPLDVNIHIYAQSGQLIRTLHLGQRATGTYLEKSHAGYWNGRNEAGEPVVSGIYFYQLEAGDFSQIRRMTVLK